MTGPVRVSRRQALACLAATAARPAAAEAMQDWVFEHARVLSMRPDEPVLEDCSVWVRGWCIQAMAPTATFKPPVGSTRIDASGCTLLPGLVDLHVHLEHFPTPDLLMLFLAHGVTQVRNLDGRPFVLDWREQVRAGRLAGPRIVSAGPLLDGHPPLRPDHQVLRSPEQARQAVAEQAALGYEAIKVYTQLEPEVYRAVVAAAREAGLPVVGHVPRGMDVFDAALAGQHSVEHLSSHGEWAEAYDSPWHGRWHWSKLVLGQPLDPLRIEDLAWRLARYDICTVPTLVQTERALAREADLQAWLEDPLLACLPGDWVPRWTQRVRMASKRLLETDPGLIERAREQRFRLVRALHAAGARLLAGSDTPNPFVLPGRSLIEELQLLAQAGLPPLDVLHMATRGAAEFLGDHGAGSLAPGLRADLLLVRGRPERDLACLHRREGVLVQGRWWPQSVLQRHLAALSDGRAAAQVRVS